eukprot:1558743-Amphidinium_carterae.1
MRVVRAFVQHVTGKVFQGELSCSVLKGSAGNTDGTHYVAEHWHAGVAGQSHAHAAVLVMAWNAHPCYCFVSQRF